MAIGDKRKGGANRIDKERGRNVGERQNLDKRQGN